MEKAFDLKILADWEPYHAVREIIANALDEKYLSSSNDIKIFKDSNGKWHIRDFGRGIDRSHLTQKENQEKTKSKNLIGKFGIGLKDAIATFNRHNVKVRIVSKHEIIEIAMKQKSSFEDIKTLHAILSDPLDSEMIGTDFILDGISDTEIEKAKELFLQFKSTELLEVTSYGSIYEKENKKGIIYINGLKVAEEEKFMFSYNITSLNKKIKKALNRERTNVGRAAYSDRIQSILLATKTEKVAELIGREFKRIQSGDMYDELGWINVQEHAVDLLNRTGKYVFLTSWEVMLYPNMMDDIRRDNKEPLIIPENLRHKIKGNNDFDGNPIVDINQYVSNYNDSFEFDFVQESDLSKSEKKIYGYTNEIISNNIRKDYFDNSVTLGVYDSSEELIVIHRNALKTLKSFSGTLVHEIIHAKTGLPDVNRDFETELTNMIGKTLSNILKDKKV
jgi:hypothetical protein